MIILTSFFILAFGTVKSAVLDPSLYLVPSPPLVETRDSVSPVDMWGRSLQTIMETTKVSQDNVATTEKPSTASSRMFWPSFRSSEPVLGVQIPLTFTLSGTYGKVAAIPSTGGTTITGAPNLRSSVPVLGKSVVATMYGNYGRSSLAGSSYGSYGSVRLYGGQSGAAWSGWGNGKWGHYGKG